MKPWSEARNSRPPRSFHDQPALTLGHWDFENYFAWFITAWFWAFEVKPFQFGLCYTLDVGNRAFVRGYSAQVCYVVACTWCCHIVRQTPTSVLFDHRHKYGRIMDCKKQQDASTHCRVHRVIGDETTLKSWTTHSSIVFTLKRRLCWEPNALIHYCCYSSLCVCPIRMRRY